VTRQHVSQYKPPADPYAHARCANCPHFVSKGHKPDRACQYAAEGCKCTAHHLREVDGDGAADA
jgi:hypothetical protein